MGQHLADEIVEGGLRLVDQGASSSGITLRAVAREVGISAPSIYAHFRDRDEIVVALSRRIFEDLRLATNEASAAAGPDPVDRLLAACRAYVEFGLTQPNRYRAIFSCELDAPSGRGAPATLEELSWPEFNGAKAFSDLVAAVEACTCAGRSDSADAKADAVAIWVYMHGLVSLRHGLERFPWPPAGDLVDRNVSKLAGIRRTA